jgi:hypothetical protein
MAPTPAPRRKLPSPSTPATAVASGRGRAPTSPMFGPRSSSPTTRPSTSTPTRDTSAFLFGTANGQGSTSASLTGTAPCSPPAGSSSSASTRTVPSWSSRSTPRRPTPLEPSSPSTRMNARWTEFSSNPTRRPGRRPLPGRRNDPTPPLHPPSQARPKEGARPAGRSEAPPSRGAERASAGRSATPPPHEDARRPGEVPGRSPCPRGPSPSSGRRARAPNAPAPPFLALAGAPSPTRIQGRGAGSPPHQSEPTKHVENLPEIWRGEGTPKQGGSGVRLRELWVAVRPSAQRRTEHLPNCPEGGSPRAVELGTWGSEDGPRRPSQGCDGLLYSPGRAGAHGRSGREGRV